MQKRLPQSDIMILKNIVEHRCLTARQLAILTGRNRNSLMRRIGQLKDKGLIQAMPRGFGGGRGRPENVLALTGQGLKNLLAPLEVTCNRPMDELTSGLHWDIDHTLLLNWFRIHLKETKGFVSRLETDFLTSTSPFLPKLADGKLAIFDRIAAGPGPDSWMDFIPDGVFKVSAKEQDKRKSLLFFLEVDMGTEPLTSSNGGRDLRQKILNFQAYFRTERYKRYEEFWNCRFNGFRLLFLANTGSRMASICRLVQEMPPSDFIWVSDQDRMFTQGLGDSIWARGGKDQAALQSIIGPSLARPTSVLKK